MVQFFNSHNQKSIIERKMNPHEAHYPERFDAYDSAHHIVLICTQKNDPIAEYIDKN